MGKNKEQIQVTQHAFLVAWGQFAREKGLVERITSVKLRQKTRQHRPQTKVLEFLVSILGGARQLQDISLAAHPLDKDQTVADAWGQTAWADYSGVSRTLSRLSWEEAYAIVNELDEFSRPFLAAELENFARQKKRLILDGDLTGIPVSNTSRSYPNAAYGQAGVVSLVSESHGRLWLSGTHHSGDTVSSTQAETLISEAEARLGLRPWRRTDLLEKRIADYGPIQESIQQRLQTQQNGRQMALERHRQAQAALDEHLRELESTEQSYRERQRVERPTRRLALLRKRVQADRKRCGSRKKAILAVEAKLAKTQTRVRELLAEIEGLRQRLKRFQEEKKTRPIHSPSQPSFAWMPGLVLTRILPC